MDLQALRYAAMVSKMTFEELVATFARYKNKAQPDVEAARSAILEFLSWDAIDEEGFAQETHILLAAGDFSKERTTTVLWLRDQGIDIRCVRMKPWRMENASLLLDVQQLIPLPEASDLQTQIGVKKRAVNENRAERHDLRLRFWDGLLTVQAASSGRCRFPSAVFEVPGAANRVADDSLDPEIGAYAARCEAPKTQDKHDDVPGGPVLIQDSKIEFVQPAI
jgi:hypothetical protein